MPYPRTSDPEHRYAPSSGPLVVFPRHRRPFVVADQRASERVLGARRRSDRRKRLRGRSVIRVTRPTIRRPSGHRTVITDVAARLGATSARTGRRPAFLTPVGRDTGDLTGTD